MGALVISAGVLLLLTLCTPGKACIFGNVMKIETTGASAATASQDKLTVIGVEASEKLAEHDLQGMAQYRDLIFEVAREKDMDPAIIAAIISRESRSGAALVDGWGDEENGFGLMQVDKNSHTPEGTWNSKEHLTQGTEILINSINAVKKKFPDWSKEEQLKGGISAYNAGVGNVQTYENMDKGTTGDDYANDVVARAQWYKHNGY